MTTTNSIVIEHLGTCENYFIDVGLVGPEGLGPLTENPLKIQTMMDDKAPPKNLNVIYQHDSTERLKIDVSWDASCKVLQKPLSYDVRMQKRVFTNFTIKDTY